MEQVKEICEKLVEMVKRWGFRLEFEPDTETSLVWTSNYFIILRVDIGGDGVVVHHLHGDGGYLTKTIVPYHADNLDELEAVLRAAMGNFVAHALRLKLWERLESSQLRFLLDFKLGETEWIMKVYDTKTKGVFLERGSLLKSPLRAFVRALKAIALITL